MTRRQYDAHDVFRVNFGKVNQTENRKVLMFILRSAEIAVLVANSINKILIN